MRKIYNFKQTIKNSSLLSNDNKDNYAENILKSHNYQYCNEINSECEKHKLEKSNDTSMDSVSENNLITRISNNSSITNEGHSDYKAFINCLLQIKFRRKKFDVPLNKINYKLMWEEIKMLKIPNHEWKSYVESQFKRPQHRTTKSIPPMNM